MGGSTSVAIPKEPNIGQDISKYVTGYGQALPAVLSLEAQYRPEFGKLNLADMGQYTTGLQAIQDQATRTAQGQLTSSKAGELASMTGLAGAGRNFLDTLSPEQAAMTRQATMAAQQAYGRSGTLSPDQMRSSTQQARESAGQSGRVGGNADVASQILNREQMLGARRAEAAQAGQQAFGMGQSMYQAPLMALLGAPSQAYNAGQQFTQYGMGLLGQSTPQMINPDTGANLAAAYRRDVLGAKSAQAQANASRSAGMMGGIGSAVGGFATAKAFMLCIPEGQVIDTPDGQKKIEDLDVGDTVIGFNGFPVTIDQKHSYREDPSINRFLEIELSNGNSISLCDKHKIDGIESGQLKDEVFGNQINSIKRFDGVSKSFDLLTSDDGYRIHGIPVNSMIEEVALKTAEIINKN
jgi:hypothetical protein